MKEVKITHNLRFVNIGADPKRPKLGWVGRRQWNACVEYNFISAGQKIIYSNPLHNLEIGDIIAAYSTGRGYVGIGRVREKTVKIKDFSFNGKVLSNEDFLVEKDYIQGSKFDNSTVLELPLLRKSLFCNCDNDNTDYALRIEWIETVSSDDAKWVSKIGLFANQSIQSNLKNQTTTIHFLEEKFKVKFI